MRNRTGIVMPLVRGLVTPLVRGAVSAPAVSGARERVVNPTFASAGTDWVNGGTPRWDFSSNQAVSTDIAPSYALGSGAYCLLSETLEAGTTYNTAVDVLSTVGGLSGVRVVLFNGTTAVKPIAIYQGPGGETVVSTGTLLSAVDRVVIFTDALSDLPGVILTRVSVIA